MDLEGTKTAYVVTKQGWKGNGRRGRQGTGRKGRQGQGGADARGVTI